MLNLLNWSIAYALPLKTRRRHKPHGGTAQASENTSNNLVDAIYSRKATDEKDRAFGLRAVLEIMMDEKLPPPNYSLPLGEIYKELTVHIFQASKTLLPGGTLTVCGRTLCEVKTLWSFQETEDIYDEKDDKKHIEI